MVAGAQNITKSDLRKILRRVRREHVAAQPSNVRGLMFNMPPRPLLANIAAEAIVGLYHATEYEAPTGGYARFFYEAGHKVALPHFTDEGSAMEFREHTDPHGESDLSPGPFGLVQPADDAPLVSPDILFVPLIGFTNRLARLGQGGGHYDRWLAAHPEAKAIGLAWDVQLCEELPLEPHDMMLGGVVTPTRMYGLD
ncbi:MAG: 5-formyltetrahydrofolate cyclo-ligase [Pseudomonadota bacterium]